MPGSLYLIAGPIGNLEDITLRAQRYLRELNYFFVEDTREIKKLFNAFAIDASEKECFSYAAHNLKAATARAIEKLESGVSVGFLSDRGTPGISDPGSVLCAQAHALKIPVIPIPGPSAVVSLLSVSGLPTDRFSFLGFIPKKEGEREQLWRRVEKAGLVFCFFESPERAHSACESVRKFFPNAKFVIGRELTKAHESILCFDASDALPEFPARGEFVIAVDPRAETVLEGNEGLEKKIAQRLASERDWAKMVAKEVGVAVSEVYNGLQKAKQIDK